MLARLQLGLGRKLPMILQSESAECGLACLAMVAAAHGNSQGLLSLRQRFGPSARGATLNGLIRIAGDLGLSARAVRCEPHELSQLAAPAILHWDFTHFVVLKRTSRRHATIHDPATGVRRFSLEEVGQHFTGIALELSPGERFEQAGRPASLPLRSFFSGLGSMWPSLGQILVLSALLQLVALATPFYMQLVVDEVLVKHDSDLLTLLAGGFLALTLFSLVTEALRGWAGIYLTNQLSFIMGARLFRHLLRLPAAFFTRRHMGDIVSRFGSIKPIQDFVTSSTITVLLDGVMAITTMTLMFLYSPLLALIVLAAMAVYLLAQLAFYYPLKLRQHESIAAEATLDSNFMESVRSIGAVKRFGIESSRNSDWQNRAAEAVNARVRVGRLTLGVGLIDSAISGISHVIVVYAGARLVLAGELSIGMLYAFLAYRNHMTSAVTSLVNEFVRFLMLSLHMERLADIQLAVPEDEQDGKPPVPIEGRLSLRDAAFRYGAHDPDVFAHVSFDIAPGESVAIFGPSGCGKSTLMACLQRSLELTGGELLVDGQPLSALGLASLRAGSASVLQDDCLLSGSLQANIAFGEPVADMERVVRAATLACIHDDIMRLPMGYESLVGEMGAAMSAGQVQRVLIARALYREPKVLFLDEGTAHLDRNTETRLMSQLFETDMTLVFITHNRSVLPHADRVLLYQNGAWIMRRVRASKLAA